MQPTQPPPTHPAADFTGNLLPCSSLYPFHVPHAIISLAWLSRGGVCDTPPVVWARPYSTVRPCSAITLASAARVARLL
jgi:hypothetical protein